MYSNLPIGFEIVVQYQNWAYIDRSNRKHKWAIYHLSEHPAHDGHMEYSQYDSPMCRMCHISIPADVLNHLQKSWELMYGSR